jgi:hypothetical protein
MRVADKLPPRSRRALAAALLVILAASIVSAFSPRVRLFVRSLIGETTYRRRGESGDPEYAVFLDGVRRLTPPDATIALVLPSDSKLYVSEAASRLAPRRVFLGREKEASFVAAYRYQYRDVRNPDVMSVPHGALFRRR